MSLMAFALFAVLAVPVCETAAATVDETARRVPASRSEIDLTFAPVVRAAAPAVVSITTRKQVDVRRDLFADDPFFRHFFRDFGVPSEPGHREQNSLGSGVVVRADGLVVTNHHVIEGADEITVILHDRREVRAEVLADDERADLAFIMLQGDVGDLPVVPLGDSDRIEVGDLVLAIGNPFGIGQTVTSGIVSAKSRVSPGRRDVSFIQTDAAINPGNSGGALIGLDGTLIGVNTAIFTRGGGGSIGIGFAIPANLVRAQMLSIDAEGTVRRPWLAADIQAVDTGLAAALDMRRPAGVVVNRVYDGGAAERAGLVKGDVILEVDGVEIFDEPGLNLRLALQPIGEQVKLLRWHDGQAEILSLRVEAPPHTPEPARTVLEGRHPFDGLEVANMSPAFNEELGLDMFETGVVVVRLARRGFASRLRLRTGDVIVAIDGEEVKTVDGLLGLIGRERRRWEISVRRDGRIHVLTVG
ncbi:MAG: Do family serine endopeptidase [Geminicoccaceae bacterium]